MNTAQKRNNTLAQFEDSAINILYADLITAMSGDDLKPGSFYRVTNRGDVAIIFQAISTNELAKDGTRIMLCPATYATVVDGSGNNWLGVWASTLTPVINDLVIWGGKVWKNVAGNVGAPVDNATLDAEWTLITKAAFANNEYIQLIFGCQYDWANDYVTKQWDIHDNVFVYDPEQDDYNNCDISDWNLGLVFYSNHCRGVYNNLVSEVYSNSNKGAIYNNTCGDSINSNSNNGPIHSNSNNGPIYSNLNNGAIYNNSDIVEEISYNANLGDIYDNSNAGEIYGNANLSHIYNNSNTGNIDQNACGSQISGNSNLGSINFNFNLFGITDNSNGGEISNNRNIGIGGNSNVGTIINNTNNGDIDLNSSGVDPCNITNNINNGNIVSGVFAADVSYRCSMSIFVQADTADPTDNSTVYFCSTPQPPSTNINNRAVIIQRYGVIRSANIIMNTTAGNAGTGENISVYINVNGADTLVETVGIVNGRRIFKNYALDIAVAPDDIVVIKVVFPAFATEPTNATWSGNLIVD